MREEVKWHGEALRRENIWEASWADGCTRMVLEAKKKTQSARPIHFLSQLIIPSGLRFSFSNCISFSSRFSLVSFQFWERKTRRISLLCSQIVQRKPGINNRPKTREKICLNTGGGRKWSVLCATLMNRVWRSKLCDHTRGIPNTNLPPSQR